LLRVQPSGHRAFKFVYSFRSRAQWYHIGSVGLGDARRIAAKLRLAVAEGKDPLAERRAERGGVTFAELAERYVEQYAKKQNKSWRQAAYLIRTNVLPYWSSLDARSITRADVRALMGKIGAAITANQTVAAISAIFGWAVKQELITVNPCKGVERNPTTSRERILADSEIPVFWNAFDDQGLVRSAALKVILLTGQRPGEVCHMCREHIKDGWWQMPGKPDLLGWPGTKNAQSHRVWLPQAARSIMAELDDESNNVAGFVFATERGSAIANLTEAMRTICKTLGIERTTPHDLRRTHGSTITALGFGRDAMNRIQNHREGGIASVYDRHSYAEENKRIMEAVANHFVALVEGCGGDNVVRGRF
jgi:integrase